MQKRKGWENGDPLIKAQGVPLWGTANIHVHGEATHWPSPNSHKIYRLTFSYILFSQSNVNYCIA